MAASGRRAVETGQGQRRVGGAQQGHDKGGGERAVYSGDGTRAAASGRRAAETGQRRRQVDSAQRGQDKGGGELTSRSGAEKGCGKKSVILLFKELREQVVA